MQRSASRTRFPYQNILVPVLLLFVLALPHVTSTRLRCMDPDSKLCFGVAVKAPNELRIALVAREGVGWAAFGIGENMNSATMYIMFRKGEREITVSPRVSRGFTTPTKGAEDSFKLMATGTIDRGPRFGAIFDIQLDRIEQDVNPDDLQTFLWAFGYDKPSNDGRFQKHGAGNAGVYKVNPKTGEVEYNSSMKSNSAKVHGTLMVLALLFFLPAGIAVARFGKHWIPSKYNFIHGLLMSIALLLASSGIAVASYQARGRNLKQGAHPILGIVLMALLLFQLVLGVAVSRLFTREERRAFSPTSVRVHGYAGWLLLPLIVATVLLGLGLLGYPAALTVPCIVLVVVWLLVFAVMPVLLRRGAGKRTEAPGKSKQLNVSGPIVPVTELARYSPGPSSHRCESFGHLEVSGAPPRPPRPGGSPYVDDVDPYDLDFHDNPRSHSSYLSRGPGYGIELIRSHNQKQSLFSVFSSIGLKDGGHSRAMSRSRGSEQSAQSFYKYPMRYDW